MADLNSLLQLLKFSHVFRSVQRDTQIGETLENDAEHSFQLALVTWYVVSTNELGLNMERALKYALAHDLVETYAGDISALGRSLEDSKKKSEAERDALHRIQHEFPHFGELHDCIRGFEERRDEEARLVYALDKLLPVMNIYLDGGRTWRRNHLTFKKLTELKDPTIALSPDVNSYWIALRDLLEVHPELFENRNEPR